MENARGCIKLLGLIWLSIVVLIAAGGAWFSHNIDKVADAAAEASGIKDAVAEERKARCARARRESQRLWDDAVNSGRADQNADRLDEIETEARRLCAGL